jgi:LmbE family N-acetylglucosaminyl deacetylase
MSLTFNKPIRILCLGAHCDDIEIGCGGTLLRWIEEKKIEQLKWIVFASTPERKPEAEKSAAAFLQKLPSDNHSVQVFDFQDSYFPDQYRALKNTFSNIWQEFKPDLIFTHFREDLHQDHRLVNQLTWNTFRNHFILEYEIAKYDGDLGHPNVYISFGKQILKEKIHHLINCFPSQTGKHWFEPETFTALPRLRGFECAAPEKYAEAFHGRKVRL